MPLRLLHRALELCDAILFPLPLVWHAPGAYQVCWYLVAHVDPQYGAGAFMRKQSRAAVKHGCLMRPPSGASEMAHAMTRMGCGVHIVQLAPCAYYQP